MSDVCGHPLDMLAKMIDTVSQVASIKPGDGSERTYFLKREVDAEVDALLNAEPEDLQLDDQAKPADQPRPPKRTTVPSADRRARWIRDELARQIADRGEPAMNESELFALALLVGTDTAAGETWDETFVQNSIATFHQRLAAIHHHPCTRQQFKLI